jgi:hypothetical protein
LKKDHIIGSLIGITLFKVAGHHRNIVIARVSLSRSLAASANAPSLSTATTDPAIKESSAAAV